ncbi:cation:proton antiporter [Streptomyces sp. NPDC021218]|uniref:cation:proton antiporter n=1 Tax=Streptomyces sp. NPDC021218 TaxID=3365119 RepID=UPI0037B53426
MSVPDPMANLLIVIPTVILACQAGALLVRRIGQPPVVGEIAVGIMLGPSLFGWMWPTAQHWLFPPSALPYTAMLGQIGLLVFMFTVGLELDLSSLRGHGRTAITVSQVSILLPSLLGALLALGMYRDFAPAGVDKLSFVLFVAVTMSITAFPVLARILTDRNLYGTRLGAVAMACAAVDDVTAWCLLAAVAAVSASGSLVDSGRTAAIAAAFLVLMFYVIRPLLARCTARVTRPADGLVLVMLFSGIFLSARTTEEIGVHALFGAFVFGVITPRGSRVIERSADRLGSFSVPVLLPLFFVHTGLSTDFGTIAGDPIQWLWTGAVCAIAVLGKLGGGTVAARLTGQTWREAISIGLLMNCRGLTELVVLNFGLQLGIIGPDLFAMLVLMALLTTAVTSPVLTRVLRSGSSAFTSQKNSLRELHSDDSSLV